MRKIIDFDSFSNQCEYFYAEDISPMANNGYNCNHPKQDYKEFDVGCCYCWTCPFGFEAEEEDFKDKEIDNNGYKKDDYAENEFLVLYSKKELKNI